LEYRVRLVSDGTGSAPVSEDLARSYIQVDGVTYKPYEYDDDGTYKYYRIDLSFILKAELNSFDAVINYPGASWYDKMNLDASNLYELVDIEVYAEYETATDDRTYTWNSIHGASDRASDPVNYFVYSNTYYSNTTGKRLHQYTGFPFYMFAGNRNHTSAITLTKTDDSSLLNSGNSLGIITQLSRRYSIAYASTRTLSGTKTGGSTDKDSDVNGKYMPVSETS